MNRNPTLLLPLLSLPVLPACSNDSGSVDIGRNVGSQLADYAATWDGYAEAFQFYDGSDRVRITLDASGHGTMVLGTAAAPPPIAFDDPNLDITQLVPGLLSPGLPYPVEGARVEEQRIRLGINLNEQYRTFCKAQPPLCSQGFCACIPPNSNIGCGPGNGCVAIDRETGQSMPVSRVAVFVCSGAGTACSCDPSGCGIGDANAFVDAALDNGGTELVGTFLANERVTVRLTRQ